MRRYRPHRHPSERDFRRWYDTLPMWCQDAFYYATARLPDQMRVLIQQVEGEAAVLTEGAADYAAFLLRFEAHGSPAWRTLVCLASGELDREDLEILARMIEAQQEDEP